MPLKHATETFLVFLLGLVIALTGLLVSTVPDLPRGAFPWAVLLVLTVLYPLIFTGLFKRNRADYAFRWLHWFPALIVLVWMALQVGTSLYEPLAGFKDLYLWGWALGAVTVGLLAIAVFCLNVIRRRIPRLALLLLIFVPFSSFAILSQSQYNWEGELAQILWEGEWLLELQRGMSGTGAGVEVTMKDEAEVTEPLKNLAKSEDEAEEAWRERLRAFERRRQMIALQVEGQPSFVPQDETTDGREEEELGPQEIPAPEPQTGTGREFSEAQTSPTSLPSAGGGVGFLGLTVLMTYCWVLHQRARRRV